MPFYRMTTFFNFNGQPPCGFSEAWEFQSNTDGIASQQIVSFLKERERLLSEDWTIVGVRMARLAVNGNPEDCKIIESLVQTGVCINPRVGVLGGADTPWAAVLIDLNTKQSTPSVGVTPKPRKWQLRGIPDDWFVDGALTIPGPAMTNIRTFEQYLINSLGAGKVRPNSGCVQLNIQLYTKLCPRRISNRQIGRPSGLLRGARRRTPVAPPPEA